MPTSLAIWLATASLSPVSMAMCFDAGFMQLTDCIRRFRADGVGHGDEADDFPVAFIAQRILDGAAPHHQHDRLALLLQGIADHADGRRRIHLLIHEELVVADINRLGKILAFKLGLDAVAGDGKEVGRLVQFDAILLGTLDERLGDVVLAQRLGAGGQLAAAPRPCGRSADGRW